MSYASEYAYVGTWPQVLTSGHSFAPGDRVLAGHLGEQDEWLIEEGLLLPVQSDTEGRPDPDAEERAAGAANETGGS